MLTHLAMPVHSSFVTSSSAATGQRSIPIYIQDTCSDVSSVQDERRKLAKRGESLWESLDPRPIEPP